MSEPSKFKFRSPQAIVVHAERGEDIVINSHHLRLVLKEFEESVQGRANGLGTMLGIAIGIIAAWQATQSSQTHFLVFWSICLGAAVIILIQQGLKWYNNPAKTVDEVITSITQSKSETP
jgi:hypothetical protein